MILYYYTTGNIDNNILVAIVKVILKKIQVTTIHHCEIRDLSTQTSKPSLTKNPISELILELKGTEEEVKCTH